MRLSTYEIILPLIDGKEEEIKDRTLLINGLYGAMDILPKEEADKLKAGNFTELPLALRERLLLRGHLTCKDEKGELADLKLLGRVYRTIFSRSGVGLVIMPTYDCNFRCPYCFERHRLCKGQEWLSQSMAPEMIDTIFQAFKDYRERGYKIGNCTLYGGEPLLASNIETVRTICQHCKELGMEIGAITNGYDLESFLDLMDEFKFNNLQITVDGVGPINDKRRLHKDGVGSYEKILKNTELALQHGIGVNMRVNVSRENLHDMKDLVDDLKARGFIEREEERKKEEEAGNKPKRGHYSYYFKAVSDDDHPANTVSEKEIIDEMLSIGFTVEEAIEHQSQYSGPAHGMQKMLKKDSFPEFNPCYCGSETGMLVIDPFGRVYSCWDLVAREDTVTGYADKESGRIIWNFDKAKWRTRTSDLLEKCQSCPYTFICRGGCASRAKSENGSYFREACSEHKEIANYLASRVAGREWEKNHQEELTLSLAGPMSRLTEADRKTLMETRSQKEMLDIIEKAGIFNENDKESDKTSNT